MPKTEDERLDALTEPRRDAPHRPSAAPTSLDSMSTADLDWVENWLIQKRGTEHAARPYGKGSLLLTTLIFEVRRERRHRADVRGFTGEDTPDLTRDMHGYAAPVVGSAQTAPSETDQIKRGERTGVLVGLGLPTLIIAAVVAALMWWHNGSVLP